MTTALSNNLNELDMLLQVSPKTIKPYVPYPPNLSDKNHLEMPLQVSPKTKSNPPKNLV